MSQEHMHPVKGLFHRYSEFEKGYYFQLWSQQEPVFTRFFKAYVEERENALARRMSIAPDYNIFSILKLHFSEVKAHTPILGNLLNPLGSHSQGTLFFRSFVYHCLPANWQKVAQVQPFQLDVRTEKRTPYGRVDIFLHSTSPINPFAIIIENKIYAKDQFKQLYRYFLYARHGLGLEIDQICVLYLSPDGRKPSMEGLTPEEKRNLELVLAPAISYHKNIHPLFNKTLEKITAGNVRHTIEQYLQTFKYLTT